MTKYDCKAQWCFEPEQKCGPCHHRSRHQEMSKSRRIKSRTTGQQAVQPEALKMEAGRLRETLDGFATRGGGGAVACSGSGLTLFLCPVPPSVRCYPFRHLSFGPSPCQEVYLHTCEGLSAAGLYLSPCPCTIVTCAVAHLHSCFPLFAVSLDRSNSISSRTDIVLAERKSPAHVVSVQKAGASGSKPPEERGGRR